MDGLSVFVKGTADEKMDRMCTLLTRVYFNHQVSFKIYDTQRQGFVSPQTLTQVMTDMV